MQTPPVAPPAAPLADGPPPFANPRKPRLVLPPGACDAHVHVYGPFDRFPLPADRSFTPNEAPERALRRLHDQLGFSRAVIVQSQGHAFDHAPLLDALRTGAGRYRGVALIRPGTTDAEIAALATARVCGARFSFMAHLGPSTEARDVHEIAGRVRAHGWHVAIHLSGAGLVEHEAFIRSIEAPVVIDHMGRPDISEGVGGPAISALRRLLDTGRVWVKLSGADRLSRSGRPFHDAADYAAAIAAHAPERVLWGTDWPHVNLHGPMPGDADLVDAIERIAPTAAVRRLMLVDNPAGFFGFPA